MKDVQVSPRVLPARANRRMRGAHRLAWPWLLAACLTAGCPAQPGTPGSGAPATHGWQQLLPGAAPTTPTVPLLVLVTPGRANLNARAADGASEPDFTTRLQLHAVVYYSDGSTDSAVTWTASDASLGTCQEGLVETGLDAGSGSLVVTARAQDDGAIVGHAIISVQPFGLAEVTVE